MSQNTSDLGVGLNDIPVLISAVGALGIAAMGTVEALFKALLIYDPPSARSKGRPFGLPYAGYAKIRRLLERVGPALQITYGTHYAMMIAAQYRADRGASQAPDMIRQGVRLGLPYLNKENAIEVVGSVWGLSNAHNEAFVAAIQASPAPGSAPSDPAAAASTSTKITGLAGRFSTALDTSVQAAFDAAEDDYQSWVRFWAGVAAVGLSLLYHAATACHSAPAGACQLSATNSGWTGWVFALVVGLAAVPLAPVAKDLSSALSQALTALKQTALKGGG